MLKVIFDKPIIIKPTHGAVNSMRPSFELCNNVSLDGANPGDRQLTSALCTNPKPLQKSYTAGLQRTKRLS